MRDTGLVIIITFALAVALTPLAEAQLSDEYAGWADGPAGFLLTKKEKKQWSKITTDAEAERFIELFWARRNPDPTSSFNRFKAEFDSKVRYAEENFSYPGRNGALTDRAKVLILMGKPEMVQMGVARDAGSGMDSTSGGNDSVQGATQVWLYNPASLPNGFKVKGSEIAFMFYEERPNSNNFVLDRSARESFKGLSVLADAPEVLVLHPDLKEVPKPVSIEGGSPASAAHLEWLDGGSAPFNDSAIVFSELGVSDGVHRPLWVHLGLPPDAPQLDLLVGRVMGSDGEVVSNFEIPAEPLPGQSGTFYHLTFSLAEGTYGVDIAGASGSEPQLTTSLTAEISSVPEHGTWLSPLWLGTAVTPNPEATLGDAFTIGGWHLTPITDPELTRASEIVYFGFVVRPELNEEGAVELRSRVSVKKDGEPLGRPLEVPLDTSRIMDDFYMYGNSIGLTGIPGIGPYEFVFEVTEINSDTSIERSVLVEITE